MADKTLTLQTGQTSANAQAAFLQGNLKEMAGANTPVVNLGYEKGKVLNAQQLNFVMPAPGEVFMVPTRIAEHFVRMHALGKLAIKGTEHMFAPKSFEVPPGYKLVPMDEPDTETMMSPSDLLDATQTETEDIAEMFNE